MHSLKTVSSRVQVSTLLRQHHNAVLGLLHKSYVASEQFEFETPDLEEIHRSLKPDTGWLLTMRFISRFY